jgi:hypothetical protein
MLMLAKEIPLLKSRTDPKPEEGAMRWGLGGGGGSMALADGEFTRLNSSFCCPSLESSSAIEPAKSPAQGSPATKPTSNKSTSNKKKGNKKKGKK